MPTRTKLIIWVAFGLIVFSSIGVLIISFNQQPTPTAPLFLNGATFTASENVHKQAPLAQVEVSATAIGYTTFTRSQGSGFFQLPLAREWKAGQEITLTFRAENFEPLQQTVVPGNELFLARLKPLPPGVSTANPTPAPTISVSNVRVRYSTESISTNNVGSIAPTLDVPNSGNLACKGDPTCSPDGQWRASLISKTLDAGPDNQFVNTRVSCIAGPCPFTQIEDQRFRNPARMITVRIRNWSDTTTFLIEAEVSRTQRSNFVREAFPAIFGQAMTFTMPAGAQGLSIQADVNSHTIIFPIGPALKLSWAACTVETSADGGKLFRCELKPPYQFHSQPAS